MKKKLQPTFVHGPVKVFKPTAAGGLKKVREIPRDKLRVRKDPGIESWTITHPQERDWQRNYVPVRDGTQDK